MGRGGVGRFFRDTEKEREIPAQRGYVDIEAQ